MDGEFGSRSLKLVREQEQRRQLAKKKIAKEKETQRLVAIRQQQLEQEKQKRLEQRLEQEQLQMQLELDKQRQTAGIVLEEELRAVPISCSDKITLPDSVLQKLNPQNALDVSSALLFELINPSNGRKTHAGVDSFTAEPGTIGVPPKTARSLGFVGATERVKLRFVRLEKGTFAQLQPLGSGFGKREVDFRMILERALKEHFALTVGDTILVRQGGETFEVAVKELKPESQVMVLNTDLEVDILHSEEEQAQQEETLKKEEMKKVEIEKLGKQKEQALLLLPPEPPVDSSNVVNCIIRLPNGKQIARKVRQSDTIQVLFNLVISCSDTVLTYSSFNLVTNYPRRVFCGEPKSMEELGLVSRRESFFVEMIAEDKMIIPTVRKEAINHNVEMLEHHNQWDTALKEWEKKIDGELHDDGSLPMHALEPILPLPPVNAASGQLKWQPQLEELKNMGFTDYELNVKILEKYQGRLLRVINYLSEM